MQHTTHDKILQGLADALEIKCPRAIGIGLDNNKWCEWEWGYKGSKTTYVSITNGLFVLNTEHPFYTVKSKSTTQLACDLANPNLIKIIQDKLDSIPPHLISI